jgi:hypothetical protein
MRTPLQQRIGKKATEWAIEHLQLLDYVLIPPQQPGDFSLETVAQLCARLHISRETFRRRRARPECPSFDGQFGPTGRILKMRSNYSLDSYLKAK